MAPRRRPSNEDIASQLDEVAAVLRSEGADRWRARAYVEAAQTVRALDEPVVELLERRGRAGLVSLPAIGQGIAKRIEDIAYGHDTHGEQLSMFGDRRSEEGAASGPARAKPAPKRAVRDLFESQAPPATETRPPVGLLLHLDRRFREHAAAAAHPPEGRRSSGDAEGLRASGEWLPTWQIARGGWRFTVRFSTSSTAQKLGRSHDWVVVEWERDGVAEQATVVTEYRGPLNGRRVVRGCERECLRYWARETERRLAEARWSRAG